MESQMGIQYTIALEWPIFSFSFLYQQIEKKNDITKKELIEVIISS